MVHFFWTSFLCKSNVISLLSLAAAQ
uniref:Uncharacterized protein n=1 Tax=Arundo donax TaxID=35708 RepID=A0A0A9HH78_ARUDO